MAPRDFRRLGVTRESPAAARSDALGVHHPEAGDDARGLDHRDSVFNIHADELCIAADER